MKSWFNNVWRGVIWKPVSVEGWIVYITYYLILLIILWVTLSQPHTTKKLLLNTIIPAIFLTLIFWSICFRRSLKR
ncbi:MAG: hypothetical protein ACOCXQ_03490 [Patescibacteria group bacterium]